MRPGRIVSRCATVVESPIFQRLWPRYWDEDERAEFASFIAVNPEAGSVVRGSGGVRKRRSVVPSKSRKLSSAEIAAFEAKRDIGAEILQSIRDMQAGKGKVVVSSATEAREAIGLSQSQFASLLGVSVRTLQGWEQGRKQPSGAARTLLAIARDNPKAVLAVSVR